MPTQKVIAIYVLLYLIDMKTSFSRNDEILVVLFIYRFFFCVAAIFFATELNKTLYHCKAELTTETYNSVWWWVYQVSWTDKYNHYI